MYVLLVKRGRKKGREKRAQRESKLRKREIGNLGNRNFKGKSQHISVSLYFEKFFAPSRFPPIEPCFCKAGFASYLFFATQKRRLSKGEERALFNHVVDRRPLPLYIYELRPIPRFPHFATAKKRRREWAASLFFFQLTDRSGG